MVKLSAFIKKDTFISMMASVIEGFKQEVGGLLFGDYRTNRKKKRKEIILKQASVLQTTKRSPYSVHFHPKRTDRVEDLWDNLSTYWPVGHFHSHPESKGYEPSPEPSDPDMTTIQKGEIELIIAIWEAKKRNRLEYIRDHTWISGAIGKYYIQLATWYLDEEEYVVPAETHCPYINVMNLGYETGLVRRPGGLFEPDIFVKPGLLKRLQRKINHYDNYAINNGEKAARHILREIEDTLEQIREENKRYY